MAEEEKDAGEGKEKPSGSRKKLLIIGLLAGLIVGCGGAPGFTIMQSGDDAASDPVEPEKRHLNCQIINMHE